MPFSRFDPRNPDNPLRAYLTGDKSFNVDDFTLDESSLAELNEYYDTLPYIVGFKAAPVLEAFHYFLLEQRTMRDGNLLDATIDPDDQQPGYDVNNINNDIKIIIS